MQDDGQVRLQGDLIWSKEGGFACAPPAPMSQARIWSRQSGFCLSQSVRHRDKNVLELGNTSLLTIFALIAGWSDCQFVCDF
jgi:hypothetical protein